MSDKQYALGAGLGLSLIAQGSFATIHLVSTARSIFDLGVATVAQSTADFAGQALFALSGVLLQAAGGGQAPSAAQVINDLGAALCRVGIGLAVVLIFWGFSVALAYWSGVDLFHWFKAKRSSDSGTRSNAGGHLQGFGKKIAGSMAIVGFPILLGAIGFSLLDCVVPAMPF